ncbi:PAS domain S-box-containing protein [Cyclonatronum proteinivorum]|uniref:PAS domain S-box-containing protein n=1 Tax=Cyclonatronum proteinivorum TaxID=1457365 RepID=A0A345UNP9_9BACT|nr:PAS domain S-box protein [Cyclonatronum proteinivorum]AXJ02101.1 PAS domain S-box-containing protein [Cyclonatronum proteinivorum]
MLDSDLTQKLQALAKDEASYETLKQLFEAEAKKAEQYKTWLELLESAVRNDYDSIIVTDLELNNPGPRICYVNDGFQRMTGYKREEVMGQTPRILQGEKTDRKTLDRLRANLEKGNSFFGQTVNYRKDGSEYINQWDIHPLTNRRGEITHWVSYQHDITERKRSEKKVMDTNTNFDDLFEGSKQTYVDLSLNGLVIDANKAFREMLGYTNEELQNASIWEFTPANDVPVLKAIFTGSENDIRNHADAFTIMFRRKNGMPVQAELNLKVLTNDGDRIARAIISNVSMRKNVLEILKKRNLGFDKVFERKNDFTYGFEINENGLPTVKWISDGFQELTGYSKDECLGEDGFTKLIHPEDLISVRKHYKAMSEGRSATQSFRILKKNGEAVQVMDYSKPDTEKSGEFKGSFVAAGKEALKTV